MKSFTTKIFSIANLKGISAKSVEEHLKLYAGYVKNANLVLEKIEELKKDSEKNAYLLGELSRRFSFEYNGIRNHEIYFASLEGGAVELLSSGQLSKAISNEWGSFGSWIQSFKALALTRGVGWAMLWYDREDKHLLMSWVDEQHLGQLQDCALILGLDMWEHAFVTDYKSSGKKQYVEDFFSNLNWKIVEENFKRANV